jgi:hypothetical protein
VEHLVAAQTNVAPPKRARGDAGTAARAERLRWWATRHSLLLMLAALAVLALAAFCAALAIVSDRSTLWVELGKGAIQILVVVVLGTALKTVVDAYQDRRRRAEQLDAFRQDKYMRLVDATNTLRRAQTLIRANRSVRTWSDQALNIVDAGLTLRRIKHEIALSSEAFPNSGAFVAVLHGMYSYTELIEKDLIAQKQTLAEKQRQAEQEGLSATERERLLDDVWAEIVELPSVGDMIDPVSSADIDRTAWSGRRPLPAAGRAPHKATLAYRRRWLERSD